MVTSRVVVDSAFPGCMRRGLGNFTADISINTRIQGYVDEPLGSTSAPGYGFDFFGAITNMKWLPVKGSGDVETKRFRSHWLRKLALPNQSADRRGVLDIQDIGELAVVAIFRVVIERQVVGHQVDVVIQQLLDAVLLHAADGLVFAFPEVAVVDEDHIGVLFHRFVDQRLRCGYPGHDNAYALTAFYLQAIRGVILKVLWL